MNSVRRGRGRPGAGARVQAEGRVPPPRVVPGSGLPLVEVNSTSAPSQNVRM